MAGPQQDFAYQHIALYKTESLGSGSYGGVCRAQCDHLPCAAKIMHPTLFDQRDPGTGSYLRKFREECRLLSLARHPNIVQYLGTYQDPETHLPVLLMELCDESLTKFLERSPGPLPYHTELSISHDIALALVYLHSNGLIHRDLTGNNILMIAGTRAKVTDFGMSKLAKVNPRMTSLTLCPGNVLYMSPEALDESPTYTDKLDIFSFGVLLVQIMTRQFPNPSNRFQVIDDPRYPDKIRRAVPEAERRHNHLQLISDTYPLKPVALQCLKNKERERPSAQEVSVRLSELKGAPQCTQSMQQAQTSSEGRRKAVDELRRQVRDLLEEREELNRKVQSKQKQLMAAEQSVAQFQQSLRQKDKVISDLQQTLSACEGKIWQLEQRVRASAGQPQQLPVTADTLQATTAPTPQKDILKLRWREGKRAPKKMMRGSVAVQGNVAFFRPSGSRRIYSCQVTSKGQQWSALPDSKYENFSLAVVANQLTTIGGMIIENQTPINSLFSLTRTKQWSEVFPPMPTARSGAAAVSTEGALIVAGGFSGNCTNTVEIMNISTGQWSAASGLPHPFSNVSGVICGDQLYLAGGYSDLSRTSKSVLTCSLTDLLSPQSPGGRVHSLPQASRPGVWWRARELPFSLSTLINLGGHLLAIGGEDDARNSTAEVHRYDHHTNSWQVTSLMKNRRHVCLAAALPDNQLIVVGGWADTRDTDIVEIAQ